MKKIGKITLHNLTNESYRILGKQELRNIRGGAEYFVTDENLCIFRCTCVDHQSTYDPVEIFFKEACNPGPWDRTKECASMLQNCIRMTEEDLERYGNYRVIL